MSATYQTFSTAATGGQPPINVSWMIVPFSVSATLFSVSTSATLAAGIQYTCDDGGNTGANSSTWRWIDTTVISTTTFQGSSQAATANISFPVTYVRANITTALSSGTVEFKVIQGIA